MLNTLLSLHQQASRPQPQRRRNEAGLSLTELIVALGLMFTGLSLLDGVLNWTRALWVMPSPAGASIAIQLTKDLSNGRSADIQMDGSGCGLSIQADSTIGRPQITYAYDAATRTMNRSSAGQTTPYPGVRCITYSSSGTLRVYADRLPGSCNPATGELGGTISDTLHQRCEYEEQQIASHLY